MDNLKQELIEILTYFNEGLKDVEAGSGEVQPMQKRTEIALREVKNLTIPVVSNRRELLIGYAKMIMKVEYEHTQQLIEDDIDEYLANL
jgi:hypothetical protein